MLCLLIFFVLKNINIYTHEKYAVVFFFKMVIFFPGGDRQRFSSASLPFSCWQLARKVFSPSSPLEWFQHQTRNSFELNSNFSVR